MHAEQSADRKHNTAAIFAHFRGVPAFAGERGGNIRIHLTDPGWMWQIPLTDGVTSIGLVMPGDRIARREGTVEAFFDNHVARNPEITRLLERAERVGELRTTGNFSYRASRAFGPGHVRVGDAFGFIDPIFSTGVHLALIGAEDAAYAILAARKQPARRSRYLMEYDRKVQRRIRYVSWFIYSIHDTSFRQLLLNPCNLFGIESAIISLLAGDFSPDRRTGIRVLLFKAIRKVAQLKKSFEDRGIGYAR